MSKPKESYKKTGYSRTSRPSLRAVRNIDKRHLVEGLSRTEKLTAVRGLNMTDIMTKVTSVIERGDYLALVESDDNHMVRILDIKNCQAVGKNVGLTIEMEIMKKGSPKHHVGEVKIKITTFILTCNPETAKVSTDYKGDHKQLVEKFTQAVQKVLRK